MAGGCGLRGGARAGSWRDRGGIQSKWDLAEHDSEGNAGDRVGRAAHAWSYVRRPGGGRDPIGETDPELVVALERLVAADCRGDPMQVLLWTSRSVRKLEVELRELGFDVHFTTVAHVLRSPRVQPAVQSQAPGGLPASGPRPAVSPDQRAGRCGDHGGQPAIWIDTKKKGLVGEFANTGREWRAKGDPLKSPPTTFPVRPSARRSSAACLTSPTTRDS